MKKERGEVCKGLKQLGLEPSGSAKLPEGSNPSLAAFNYH
jgi:hypothetical protein